jgi:hypothetical protein
MAKPIRILYHCIRQLRRRPVDQVKVKWDKYSMNSVTYEDAYDMHQQFLFLFDIYTYDTMMHIILSFIYCETLGKFLEQEGVYVTSRSCVHRENLFFEDTFLQVIRIIILLGISL